MSSGGGDEDVDEPDEMTIGSQVVESFAPLLLLLLKLLLVMQLLLTADVCTTRCVPAVTI